MSYRIVLMVLIGAATLSTSDLYAGKRNPSHVTHTETKTALKENADHVDPLVTNAGNTLHPFPGNFFKKSEKKRVQKEVKRFEEELVDTINTLTASQKTLATKEREAQQKEEDANRALQQAEADLAIKEERVRQEKKNRAQRIFIALNDQYAALPPQARQEFEEALGAPMTSDTVKNLDVQGLEDPEIINNINVFADKWSPIFMPKDAERNKTWVRVVLAD
ncbi:OmpH family outer membrane protein [Candidatus Hepatobacter penaei]|uniref:OmpH family outer membrane protein n=1 Tax=Candidatus Hepatobacter penaei TaxID=1274402 RepID=UPI0004F3DFF2|nr:OmpH family outer membrane protein [Candidatus Hepatobacter penaei]